MKNIEYDIVYKKYKQMINDPAWIATKPLRKLVDKIKYIINPKLVYNDLIYSNDAFETLFLNYDKLANSKFWMLTAPFRKKKKNSKKENRITDEILTDKYKLWIKTHENSDKSNMCFTYNPLFSIIVPVYNVKKTYLLECVNSIRSQYYKNYELILVDDRPALQETIDCLKELEAEEDLIVIHNDKNGGISKAINIGLDNAKGDFIVFVDNDDVISNNALYEIVKSLNQNKYIDIFYSDEDKIDASGKIRFMPRFKPDYSPDLLLNNNYFCHLLVIRKQLCDMVGKFNSSFDGAQDFEYILRCVEKTSPTKIAHINKILYHWRAIEGSTSLSVTEKPKIKELTNNIKLESIKRRNVNAYIEEDGNVYYHGDGRKISIIIPSKDNYDALINCLNSILYKITYENYEIIIVDNGSSEENREKISEYIKKYNFIKYIYQEMPFNFSKSCNLGVEKVSGDYLLFLNDDIEIVYGDLLDKMSGYARQKHIGAVGTKLLYPNSTTIQHCGIINAYPGPTHSLQHYDDSQAYYENFNKTNEDVFGVTAACLMIEKTKYLEIGGFDNEFGIDYGDVDLCIRLLKHNYYNVCLNGIYSYHHESMTRIIPDEKLILKRVFKLYSKHPDYYLSDKYYSENFKLSSNDFEY